MDTEILMAPTQTYCLLFELYGAIEESYCTQPHFLQYVRMAVCIDVPP